MKQIDPLGVIGAYGERIDARARALLSRSDYALYGMMKYFMGYTDEHFNTNAHSVGKRMRPGLLLLIADSYGILEDALPAALSIELFHNFTLIHDDVIDHDEFRRGRPTVWKFWGVGHAINTGDAQLILALRALEEPTRIPLERVAAMRTRLLDRYLEVGEGQYLDLTLAAAKLDDPTVTEEAYLVMIKKKTAKLVCAALEAAGILAGRDETEVTALGDFGENLGMAYQLYDDWQGIWGAPEKTGKKRAGDIYERKKTLPIIHAHQQLDPANRKRLEVLYDKTTLDEIFVTEILELFTKTTAQQALERCATRYKEQALKTLAHAELPVATKTALEQLVRTLVPDVIAQSR